MNYINKIYSIQTSNMENSNNNQENNFGIPNVINTGAYTDDNGRLLMNVDVMDEVLSGKQTLENAAKGIRQRDSFVINDINYYYKKYSAEDNPSNPTAPRRAEIDKLYQNTAMTNAYRQDLLDKGVTMDFVDYERRRRRLTIAPTDFNMDDSSTSQISYQGHYDPKRGKYNHIATEQEMAEWQDYMFVKTDEGMQKIAKPSLKEMEKQFTDKGMVITTTLDKDNNYAPVLIAKPNTDFVQRDMLYSTRHGARKTFDNALGTFFRGVWDGAIYGTASALNDLKNFADNAAFFDSNYIFTDGFDKLDGHVRDVVSALNNSGQFNAAERLIAAYENKDFQDLKENLTYSYAALEPSEGRVLMRQAQQPKWEEIDKAYEAATNLWTNKKKAVAKEYMDGRGMAAFVARQGETVGYLLPQIAIGALTAGASTYAGAAASAVRIAGRILAGTVGSSQAFQAFWRTGIESGIDRDTLTRMSFWALPATMTTEVLLNGWMFRSADKGILAAAMKETIEPMTKKFAAQIAGKTATESQVRKFTFKAFGDLLKNNKFRDWINSGSYLGGLVQANMQEVAQENLEEVWYNAIQKYYIDEKMPEYYETGKGKFGTESLMGDFSEITMGTIFATTLVQGIMGGIPRMIKRAKGVPTTKNEMERARYFNYQVLKNGDKPFLDFAAEENKKENNIFGNKAWKIKDASLGSMDGSEFVVPENDFLQAQGYEAGTPIEDLATMRFVEFVMDVQSYAQMAKEMNLSELDMKILSQAGFNDQISLSRSIEAFTTMKERKSEIEAAIASQEVVEGQEGVSIQSLEDKYEIYKGLKEAEAEQFSTQAGDIFAKYITYRESLEAFQYYSKPEAGTNYSQASNDMVKRNKALYNQVQQKMREEKGWAGDLTKEQKNDPDVIAQYLEMWNRTLEEEFKYEHLRSLFDNVMLLAEGERKRREDELSALDTDADFTGLQTQLTKLSGDFDTRIKEGDTKALSDVLKEFGNFTDNLVRHFHDPESMVSMRSLNELKGKYSQLFEQAKQALGIIREEETSSIIDRAIEFREKDRVARKNTANQQHAELTNNIQQLQQQIDQHNQVDLSVMNETELAAHNQQLTQLTDSLNDVIKQDESIENETAIDADIDKSIAAIKQGELSEENEGLLEKYGEEKYFDELFNENTKDEKFTYQLQVDENGVVKPQLPKAHGEIEVEGDTFFPEIKQREETDEQYDKRKKKRIDDLKNAKDKSYLENWLTDLHNRIEEAKTYVESTLANDGKYKEKYPDGQLNASNATKMIGALSNVLDQYKFFGRGFTVAKSLFNNGKLDNSVSEHMSPDEKLFIAEMASNATDNNSDKKTLESMFDEIMSMNEYVKDKTGEVELINQKKLLHMQTVMSEMRLQSIAVIVNLELKTPDNKLLLPPELLQAYNELQPLSDDVIKANGQYSPELMTELSKRRKIVDDILSFLQQNKEVVFNKDNQPKVFAIFDKLRQVRYDASITDKTPDGIYNQDGVIFTGSDMNAHMGDEAPRTGLTRESFLTNPLISVTDQGIVYSFEREFNEDVVRNQLREHFNVLTWINSKYSINQLNSIRRKLYKEGIDVETAEQESALNSLVSHLTVSTSDSVLTRLWEHMQGDKFYSGDNFLQITSYLKNAITVGGDYGTGKTQFLLPRLFRILNELETGSDRSVTSLTFVGITEKLRSLHEKSFALQKNEGAQFIPLKGNAGFIENVITLPKTQGAVYVIDEASIIGEEEYDAIAAAFKNTGAKIIFLGDMFQMKDPESFDSAPQVMRRTMTTTLLTHQFSSNSPLLRSIAEATRKTIGIKSQKAIIYPNVAENTIGPRKLGARYFANRMEVYNSFVASKNNNKALVFANGNDYQEFVNSNPNLKEQLNKLRTDNKVYFAIPEANGDTEHLLQGLREEEVYIAFAFEDFAKSTIGVGSGVMGAAMYTAVGRASHWAGIITGSDDIKKNVSESEAQSVGIGMENNEFMDNIRSKMKEMYDIWYNNFDEPASEKGKDAEEAVGEKTVEKVAVVNGYVDVKYTRNGDIITLMFENRQMQEKFDSTNDDASAEEFIRSLLSTYELTNVTPTEVKQDVSKNFIQTSHGVIEEDAGVTIVTNGVAIKGTIDTIESDGVTGTVNIITQDNVTIPVAVKTTTNIYTQENFEDTDERSIEEKANVSSASKFAADKKNDTLWGSSASVINSVGAIHERVRAINDAVVSHSSLFGDNFKVIRLKNVDYRADDNTDVKKDKLIALAIDIDINDAFMLDKLSQAFKGTRLEAEWNDVRSKGNNAIVSFLRIKNGQMVVGTIGEAHMPSGTIESYSLVNANNKSAAEIATAFDLLIAQTTNNITADSLREQKEYNLALRSFHDNATHDKGTSVKIEPGNRKIEYQFGPNSRVPVNSVISEELYPGITINATPRYRSDGRMLLGFVLPGGIEMEMVVSMPKFNEKSEKGTKALTQMKERLTSEKNMLAEAKINPDNVKDEFSSVFAGTTLYRLIRANKSTIMNAKSGTLEAKIREHITIDTKGKGHINLKGHDAQTIQNSYQKLIGLLLNDKTGLAVSQMYDYLDKVDGKFQTHDGSPIIESLVTQAARINNTQFYIKLPKEAKPAEGTSQQTAPKTGRRGSNANRGRAFEQTMISSKEMITLETAKQQLRQYLGDNFVDSQYFLIHDGYIKDGHITAAGMVEANVFLTLSQINGKVHASTPAHEAFHVIYRNFVNPRVKQDLIRAARRIAKHEGVNNIEGNEEEWMASDFAKGRNPELYKKGTIKDNVSLWERFKNFINGIINRFNPLYRANARLANMYQNILDGKYQNRTGDLKVNTESEVAYEEMSIDDYVNDFFDEEKRSPKKVEALYEAQKKKNEYVSQVNALSLTDIEIEIKTDIIQNSYLGNLNTSEQLSLGETFDKIINTNAASQAESFADMMVDIRTSNGNVPMTVKYVVENNLIGNLALSPDENSLSHADAKYIIDKYRMYSDRDFVVAMVQLAMPSVDIVTGSLEWGSPANERYDWSSISPESYINDMTKLYLSVVPYINADGSVVTDEMNVIPFKTVNSIMKIIGRKAYNISTTEKIDQLTAMKVYMENLIDTAQIADVEVDGRIVPKYQSSQVAYVHSLYNYIFRAKGKEGMPNYLLNYNQSTGTDREVKQDTYMGLFDKASVLGFNPNVDTKTVDEMKNFVFNLVGLYTSYYVKNQSKHIYYEYGNKLKTIHYNSESWRKTSARLKDKLGSMVRDGELSKGTAEFMKANVSFNGSQDASNPGAYTIAVKINHWDAASTDFLFYNGKSFSFVTDNGGISFGRPIDINLFDDNFSNAFDIFNRIRSEIGIEEINGAVFQAMLTATSWEQVTDILRQEEKDKAHLSNFMTKIRSAYNKPIDFFADYIGTIMTLHNMYAQKYVYEGAADESGYKTTYYDSLAERVKRLESENMGNNDFNIFDHIPNSDVVLNFLDKTSYSNLNVFKESDIADENDSPVDGDVKSIRYPDGRDLWIAHDMMGSVVQKINSKYDDGSVYTAEGQRAWNVALRNRLMDVIPNSSTENITIETITESLGVTNDMNVAKNGKTVLDTKDYIDTSIKMFMQEVYKSRNNLVMYVPLIPAADTGKIVHAKVKSPIVSMNNGIFSINYEYAAKELLNVANKVNKEILDARKRLNDTLVGISKEMKLRVITETGNESRLDELYSAGTLTNMMIAMSEEAHKKGVFEELKRRFDHSSLKKDIKGIKNFVPGKTIPLYDVSYQMHNGNMVIVPGATMLGDVPGYKYLAKTYQEKGVRNIPVIETIEKTLNDTNMSTSTKLKVLENMVHKMFRNEFIAMTKMLAKYDIEQAGTTIELNNSVSKSQKLDNNKSYYTGKGASFNPQKPLFAYFMLTLFTNEAVSNNSVDAFSFRNFLDTVKRNGPVHTPGQNPVINAKWERNGKEYYVGTLAETNPFIAYYDNWVNAGSTFQNIDGKDVLSNRGNEVEPENGETKVFPLYSRFFAKSFGGATHTMLGDSNMLKTLSNYKRDDGSQSQIKRADHIITGFDMQSSTYRNMFNRMMAESDKRISNALAEKSLPNYSLKERFEEAYNEYKDFERAIDALYQEIINLQFFSDGTVNDQGVAMYEQIVSNIVAFMAPVSTQKGAITHVNEFNHYQDDLNIPMATDMLSNRDTKVIMNPAQDVNTDKLQAFPSQMESFFGVSDSKMVQGLARLHSEAKFKLQQTLAKEISAKISQEVDKNGDKVPADRRFSKTDWLTFDYENASEHDKMIADKGLEQLETYFRKAVATNLSISGQDLAYIYLFLDGNISVNMPMMRQKLVQTYLNVINKMIQARTTGIRVTQTSGEYVQVYEKDEQIYSRNDVLDAIYGDYKTLSWSDYTSVQTDERIDSEGFKIRQLNDMRIDNGNTLSGEVVMSNIFKDKYGHRDNESYHQIITASIAGQRVLLDNAKEAIEALPEDAINGIEFWDALADSPMIRKAASNLDILEKFNKVMDAYDRVDIDQLMQRDTDALIRAANNETKLENAETLDTLKKIVQMGLNMDILTDNEKIGIFMAINQHYLGAVIDEAISLKNDFEQSMDMLLSRVPATFIGSGGVYKTVLFHNSGNVVYIPTGMTLRNDSDFDIDALTAYSNAINEYGHIEQEGANGIRNDMNNIRKDVMLSPDTQPSLFVKSSLKAINEVSERRNKKTNQDMMNSSFTSIIEAYKRNKAGADGIGILANTETALSYILSNLATAHLSYNQSGHLKTIINRSAPGNKIITGTNSLITSVGSWQQGTLDNAKNNTFGNYGVPQEATHILGVLAASETNEYLYDFFNNPYVQNLLDEYSVRSSIIKSTYKYDLYAMATLEAQNIQNRKTNSSRVNFNTLNETNPFATQLNIHDANLTRNIDTVKDELYERFKSALLPYLKAYYAPKGRGQVKYFMQGTNEQEELNRWLSDHERGKYSIENLFDAKTSDNILDKEGDFADDIKAILGNLPETDETKALFATIKAFGELRALYDLSNGYDYIARIPALEVTATALFRLSSVLGLRNGIPVLDVKFMQTKQLIELSLGMSLEDFVSFKPQNKVDIRRHMQYFLDNNETVNRLRKDEDQQLKALLKEKEEKVANELNLPLFIKGLPQMTNILNEYVKQDKIKSSMFIVDSALVKSLQSKMLELQHMKAFQYGQQLAEFNNAINDFILDYYYQTTDKKIYNVMAMSTLQSTKPEQLDLRDLYQRQEFISGFPELVIELTKNKDNVDFLKTLFPSENMYTDEQLINMSDNVFLSNLEYKVKGDYIGFKHNTKEFNPYQIAMLQDSFNELPEYIRNMFRNYELIRNRMNYRQGGILQIIGIDFYRGRLSEAYNEVIESIKRTNGLQAFMVKKGVDAAQQAKFDKQLEQRLFDYLGTDTTFAQHRNLPLASNDPELPMYVYNYGKEENNRRPIFYKRNESGAYEEVYRISYSITTNPDEVISSQVPVFKATIEELDGIKNNKAVMTHYGSTTLYRIQRGDFRMTQTGVLVRVNDVKGYSFTYHVVSSPSEMEILNNRLKKQAEKATSGKILIPGELSYEILSPNKEFNFNTETNPILKSFVIKTVDSKGKEITIPAIPKGEYKTIKDIINAVRQQAILSIDYKRKGAFSDKEGLDKLNNPNYLLTVANGLVNDVLGHSTRMSDAELDVYNKQVKSASLMITNGIPIIVKEIIKANMQAYANANGSESLYDLGNMVTYDTVYGPADENLHVGFTKYGNGYGAIARQGVREFFKMDDNYRLKEEMLVSGQQTIDIYTSLFDEGRADIFKASRQKAKTERLIPSTADVMDANNAIQQFIRLSDDNKRYLVKDTVDGPEMNVARLSDVVSIVAKELDPSLKLGEIDPDIADIGTEADNVARDYLRQWNDHRTARLKGDPNPMVSVASNMRHVDLLSLKQVLFRTAKAIESWAVLNGYDAEFITDELWTYDMNHGDNINRQYNAVTGDIGDMNIQGVATRQDLVVRMKQKNSSYYVDYLIDFKTTSLKDITPKKGDKRVNNTNLRWALQVEATGSMLSNTHGLNIHGTKFILPLMKTTGKNAINGKKIVTFGIAPSLLSSIESLEQGKKADFPLHETYLSTHALNTLHKYVKTGNGVKGYENMKSTIDNSDVFNYCK